ncbi:MAG: hypothetical protein AAGI92_06685 [Pseudomonadota bacterium]
MSRIQVFARRFTIGLAVLTAGLFLWMSYYHIAYLTPASGGVPAPDMAPLGYDLTTLQAWLNAMDESEREEFIARHTLTYDLIFPFLLAWTLYRALDLILNRFERFQRQSGSVKALTLLTLVLPYLAFDMLENFQVLQFLSGRAELDQASASLLASYTVLKYASVVFTFSVLAAFSLALITRGQSQPKP